MVLRFFLGSIRSAICIHVDVDGLRTATDCHIVHHRDSAADCDIFNHGQAGTDRHIFNNHAVAANGSVGQQFRPTGASRSGRRHRGHLDLC